MTMCSIFGSVSVPSGSVGFGREPGLRNTFGMADAVVSTFTVGGVDVGVDDFDDDEQPASSATASPAPATAIPRNNDRRLTASKSGSEADWRGVVARASRGR